MKERDSERCQGNEERNKKSREGKWGDQESKFAIWRLWTTTASSSSEEWDRCSPSLFPLPLPSSFLVLSPDSSLLPSSLLSLPLCFNPSSFHSLCVTVPLLLTDTVSREWVVVDTTDGKGPWPRGEGERRRTMEKRKKENVSRIQIIRNRFSLRINRRTTRRKKGGQQGEECERESEEWEIERIGRETLFQRGSISLKRNPSTLLSPFLLLLFLWVKDFDHLSYLVPSLCSRKRRIFCVSNKKEGERNLHNKAASVSFFFLLSCIVLPHIWILSYYSPSSFLLFLDPEKTHLSLSLFTHRRGLKDGRGRKNSRFYVSHVKTCAGRTGGNVKFACVRGGEGKVILR